MNIVKAGCKFICVLSEVAEISVDIIDAVEATSTRQKIQSLGAAVFHAIAIGVDVNGSLSSQPAAGRIPAKKIELAARACVSLLHITNDEELTSSLLKLDRFTIDILRFLATLAELKALSYKKYLSLPDAEFKQKTASSKAEYKDKITGFKGFAALLKVNAVVGSYVFSEMFSELFEHFHVADELPMPDEVPATTWDAIPDAFQDDPILTKFFCPITQSPIRTIVGDPNGHAFYEKNAIEAWLTEHSTSPVTGLPLLRHQLIERPDLQDIINQRLAVLELSMNILQNRIGGQ